MTVLVCHSHRFLGSLFSAAENPTDLVCGILFDRFVRSVAARDESGLEMGLSSVSRGWLSSDPKTSLGSLLPQLPTLVSKAWRLAAPHPEHCTLGRAMRTCTATVRYPECQSMHVGLSAEYARTWLLSASHDATFNHFQFCLCHRVQPEIHRSR